MSRQASCRCLSSRAIVWAAVVLIVLGVGLAVGLLVAFGDGQHSAQLDAIKTAGTIVLGTGGAAALWLAARRQRTSELSRIPALGTIRLDALTHHHVALFISDQLGAGRGAVTLRRCVAMLSSSLTDAVRQRRLPHNPARYALVPRPPKYEPACWTPSEAARFLRWCHDHDDPLADLFEVLIGTGLRKGEALALHWNDINLDDHVLFVRFTLSNVNNTTPVFTTPKTKTSRTWIGLSDRVVTALHNQMTRQSDRELVFTRRDGHPLRHEHVLHRFHSLTAAAGLPRIRVHDLRHFAATTMLNSRVPLSSDLTRDAPLEPLHHHRGLRPPATTRRPRRRRRHRQRTPRSGPSRRTGSMRPHRDHIDPQNETSGFTMKVNPLVLTVGTTGFEPATP